MNYKAFLSDISKSVGNALEQIGFAECRAGQYVCLADEQISVIEFQRHRSKKTCCVNLGVHYTFIPKVSLGECVVGIHIDEVDCEIRFRLTNNPNKIDQWWDLAETSIQEVSNLILEKSPIEFEKFRLDGELASLTVNDFSDGVPELLKSMTRVRALLLLTRIRDYYNDESAAIELARFGLKVAGRAVVPKVAFKEILKRRGVS